jgi:hypothetical protein
MTQPTTSAHLHISVQFDLVLTECLVEIVNSVLDRNLLCYQLKESRYATKKNVEGHQWEVREHSRRRKYTSMIETQQGRLLVMDDTAAANNLVHRLLWPSPDLFNLGVQLLSAPVQRHNIVLNFRL